MADFSTVKCELEKLCHKVRKKMACTEDKKVAAGKSANEIKAGIANGQ